MNRYRIFNWTVFGLVCYLAALPVIGRGMRFLLPVIWHCPYRAMTGRPCPFCGTTRDLARLWHGNFDFGNPATPFLVLFLVAELIWRLILLSRRHSHSRALIVGDTLVHIPLVLLLLGAYLWFWYHSTP